MTQLSEFYFNGIIFAKNYFFIPLKTFEKKLDKILFINEYVNSVNEK